MSNVCSCKYRPVAASIRVNAFVLKKNPRVPQEKNRNACFTNSSNSIFINRLLKPRTVSILINSKPCIRHTSFFPPLWVQIEFLLISLSSREFDRNGTKRTEEDPRFLYENIRRIDRSRTQIRNSIILTFLINLQLRKICSKIKYWQIFLPIFKNVEQRLCLPLVSLQHFINFICSF